MGVPRFWREKSARYNLEGKQCGNCSKVFFPPREMCTDCHRLSIGKMKPINFRGEGEIITWTVVHNAPPAFEMQVPYILAIIRLDEGTCLTGQIVDAEPEDLAIGKRVHAVFRKISEDGSNGIINYGCKFRIMET